MKSYKILILKSHCCTVILIMTAILNMIDSKLLGDNSSYGMFNLLN